MFSKIIGWLLFVWGTLGILADVVYLSVAGDIAYPGIVVIRMLVSVAFILGGWKLSHRKPKPAKDITPTR